LSVSLGLSDGRRIETELPAFVMAILNATPDSFWEGSRTPGYASATGALDADAAARGADMAFAFQADGADIIDIGGESTRPGSAYVTEEEELSRVIPLIKAIRKKSDVPISVDTRKSRVLEAALAEGADMLNDVSALADDPAMAPLAARTRIPVILMHKRGSPGDMQVNPFYDDPVREVIAELLARVRFAEDSGIARERIILDPGIGFGKRHSDNVALIAGLAEIAATGYPVLMALSRKSVIGEITSRTIEDRLAGTLAANLIAVQRGAFMLRVHDVRETCDALRVLKEIEIRKVH
jgi:dihydropteroate synthase